MYLAFFFGAADPGQSALQSAKWAGNWMYNSDANWQANWRARRISQSEAKQIANYEFQIREGRIAVLADRLHSTPVLSLVVLFRMPGTSP